MVDRSFNDECIVAHNNYRRAHGCPNLSFDSQLASSAQAWAERLAKAKCLEHSTSKDYGENLANRQSSGQVALSGADATKMWYDEVAHYKYGSDFTPSTGHFTQVIWKSTTHAGFGRAFSSDGHCVFVVGRYSPPGNMLGNFAQNVPPPEKNGVAKPAEPNAVALNTNTNGPEAKRQNITVVRESNTTLSVEQVTEDKEKRKKKKKKKAKCTVM